MEEQTFGPDSGLARLAAIVRTLRGPDGCPWDKKQSSATLVKYLLEESRELAEAIESGDPVHVCEEVGDLFFILSIVTICFEEQGKFTLNDALASINEKMIRRHPHVFGGATVASEQELREQWNRIKNEEKSDR